MRVFSLTIISEAVLPPGYACKMRCIHVCMCLQKTDMYIPQEAFWFQYKDAAFVSQGCGNKFSSHEQLQQQGFVVSELWSLEVQDEGLSRTELCLGLQVRSDPAIPCLFPSFVGHWHSRVFLGLQRHHPNVGLCLHTVFFMCAYLCPAPSLPPVFKNFYWSIVDL